MPLRSTLMQPASLVYVSEAKYQVTSGTSETILQSIQLPPLTVNAIIQIFVGLSFTSSANNKTWRCRFGTAANTSGTIIAGPTRTTSASELNYIEIKNLASLSSQIGSAGFGASSSARATASVNTANASYLVFTGQTATSGETISLDEYMVRVWL